MGQFHHTENHLFAVKTVYTRQRIPFERTIVTETPKPRKKVVRAAPSSSSAAAKSADSKATSGSATTSTKSASTKKQTNTEITWQASPEAKAKARNFRIIAIVAWVIALAVEFYVIYVELQRATVKTWLVIALIVLIGVLAIGGNLLWRKANRMDPASEKDKVRFFIQNQLGAFIAAIAFLPLIVFVFTNKNMSTKQKGVIGAIAILLFGGAAWTGVETNSASQEQYSQDKNLVLTLTGKDEVYWTAGGGVYHLCDAVSDLQRESESNEIVVGTIEQAHDAGKDRLTKKVTSEAKQCGIDESVYGPAIAAWDAGTLTLPGSESTEPGTDESTDATDESTDSTDESTD